MASQKGKAAGGAKKATAKARAGIPTLVRTDQAPGGKTAAGFKPPTKPKVKDRLRDGAPKPKKSTK
ncbi:MAG TPA: hypothetical protein VJZ91_08645 [Blastocatellia bacterium]|nr:hypothetical protein [Blastocatellia bacterium]